MKIINYDDTKFNEYKDNLKLIGSLSLLFGNSKNPMLDYRVPENLYCQCFGAQNIARSCVTADANFNGIGVGIKTFVEENRHTFQKIAEFNKARASYSNLEPLDKIKKISELRNERIDNTIVTYNLTQMIYHCIVRNENGFHFYEEAMDKIDIENISIISQDEKSIIFTDNIHEYNFNLSKSVLLKRFNIDEYFDSVTVQVAENPLDVLRNGINSIVTVTANETAVIPLYSISDGEKIVYPRSGLNQWNAGGRQRSINEVYIPFNRQVRNLYENFFPDINTPFNVTLPNGRIMSMKICQQGGKAIMSNPNSELGEWLLREVLLLDANEILTYSKLVELGIDSVIFEKNIDGTYKLDFVPMSEESDE